MLPPVQLLLDQLLRSLKELILVKLHRLVQLVRQSKIMIVISKLEKHLSMELGTLTLKDQQLAILMLLGINMVLVIVSIRYCRNLISFGTRLTVCFNGVVGINMVRRKFVQFLCWISKDRGASHQ